MCDLSQCNIIFQLILVSTSWNTFAYLICLHLSIVARIIAFHWRWLIDEFSRHTHSPSESLIFRKRALHVWPLSRLGGAFARYDTPRVWLPAINRASTAGRVYRIRGDYFQNSWPVQKERGRDGETKEDNKGELVLTEESPRTVWLDAERLDAFIGPRAIARAV